MIYWKYFKFLLRHKYLVLRECWKVGLYWQGITHDLSKFLPDEFIPNAKYLFADRFALSDDERKKIDEDHWQAAIIHQNRNKHHWQYWFGFDHQGETMVLEMPEKCLKEMICDWTANSIIHGGDTSPADWFVFYNKKMVLHPATKKWIQNEINRREKELKLQNHKEFWDKEKEREEAENNQSDQ